jgi:multiple sugar transport system substrate-binding protein/raffinose/stachyose/melibiose transport system substrate-binding protein
MPSGAEDQAAPEIKQGSVLADVVTAFQEVSAANGQVPFVQNATAGITNQGWNPQTQLLLGGKESAKDYVANVQETYEQELSQ